MAALWDVFDGDRQFALVRSTQKQVWHQFQDRKLELRPVNVD
jgi:hypothetical protein